MRSEAAIGTVLECPKCQSMVHVIPPEGWKMAPPEPPPVHEPSRHAPPPLNQVASGPMTLDLEPAKMPFLGRLASRRWLLGAVGLALGGFSAWMLWLAMSPASHSQSTNVETKAKTKQPAAAAKPNLAQAVANKDKDREKPRRLLRKSCRRPPRTSRAAGTIEIKTGRQKTRRRTTCRRREGRQQAGCQKNAAGLRENRPGYQKTQAEPEDTAKDAKKKPAEPEITAPELKKSPPPRVDVAARLTVPLPDLELTDDRFASVLDLLATMSTTPITLNPDALAQRGATPRDPITLHLSKTTIGEALQAVGTTRVGNRRRRRPSDRYDSGRRPRENPQRPLYGFRFDGRRPSCRRRTGGDRAAAGRPGVLARQRRSGNHRISSRRVECRADRRGAQSGLGVLREVAQRAGKPLRSRSKPERFALATRWDQAKKCSKRRCRSIFTTSVRWPASSRSLRDVDCDILIDRAALAAAETSDRVESALSVRNRPLGDSLAELLKPLGLTYRTVGDRLVQITTKEAADEHLELEFYAVGPWLDRGESGPRLIERLKTQIASPNWTDMGGLGDVYFDAPSRHLIVLQSQAVQAAIERLLKKPPR